MARVVLLTSEGTSGAIAARYLAGQFPDIAVICEGSESRWLFIRRRMKRLGPVKVAGQVMFMLLQRFQQRRSQQRIAEVCAPLSGAPDPAVAHVPSVNSPECLAALRELRPGVVLVMGTRIIKPEVMAEAQAPFINYHAGITPKYRGVHGGYWALAEGDAGNFGLTVHLVDAGIDTGGILYQERVRPSAADNFSTFPYLQLAAGLPLLAKAARDALAGHLTVQFSDLPSRLWSHPTIWQYVLTGFRRGVW